MARISVAKACGANRVSRRDGEALRHLLEAHWDDREPLVLDFAGLVIASVSFFDESFGVMALYHPLAELTKRIKVENIRPPDRTLLNNIVLARSRERDGTGAAMEASDRSLPLDEDQRLMLNLFSENPEAPLTEKELANGIQRLGRKWPPWTAFKKTLNELTRQGYLQVVRTGWMLTDKGRAIEALGRRLPITQSIPFQVVGDLDSASTGIAGIFPVGEGRRFGAYVIGRDEAGTLWVCRDSQWRVPVDPRELATIGEVVAEAEAKASSSR